MNLVEDEDGAATAKVLGGNPHVASSSEVAEKSATGEDSLPALTTSPGPTATTPAPDSIAHSRKRRQNAGAKLPCIIEEVQKNGEEEAEEGLDATLGTETESGETSNTINISERTCCLCAKALTNNDTTVPCRGTKCLAAAHHQCAGYTAKGANPVRATAKPKLRSLPAPAHSQRKHKVRCNRTASRAMIVQDLPKRRWSYQFH